MSEPLWSNARIDAEIESIEQVWITDSVNSVARRIRNDYESRIAKLEAQLAQRSEWQPVVNDVIPGEGYNVLQKDDGRIAIDQYPGESNAFEWLWVQLPDHIRLCRRTNSDA